MVNYSGNNPRNFIIKGKPEFCMLPIGALKCENPPSVISDIVSFILSLEYLKLFWEKSCSRPRIISFFLIYGTKSTKTKARILISKYSLSFLSLITLAMSLFLV